jgi:KDO2-lipid IV(A) lauroyltransferase
MPEKKTSGNLSLYLVKSILILTRMLPLKMSYAFCNFIVFAGSGIKFKRKNIGLENIRIVFPGKSPEERKLILKESLRKILKSFFEFAYIVNGKTKRENILVMAEATGLQYLDNLKSKNQGALLYSGHFGNFPLMIIWLALKGYPIAAIYKEGKNLPEDFFGNLLRKSGVTPLKYKSDASLIIAVIRALKDGKIVLIQNDQSHPQGIYINFFNKYVPSPAGPALLAKRTGVPVIPAYIHRDDHNHHKITILPEMQLHQEDDLERFLKVNTQLMIDWIADILIRHPTEWLWLHNRWKRAKERDADNQVYSER